MSLREEPAGHVFVYGRKRRRPKYGDLGPAFPAWTSPAREPILQPPRPEIPASPQILQRVMDRDADWEAGD
jgi:hypothetical protein